MANEYLHTRILKAGVVVAYIAPQIQVDSVDKNNLTGGPRPGERAAISRDRGLIQEELTVQWDCVHSDLLPDDHKAALAVLFGALPVTPEQQVNRLLQYFHAGGPFEFYRGTDQYKAVNDAAINRGAGIFPNVQWGEARRTYKPAGSKIPVVIRLMAGVER